MLRKMFLVSVLCLVIGLMVSVPAMGMGKAPKVGNFSRMATAQMESCYTAPWPAAIYGEGVYIFGDDLPKAIVADSDGNVYVTGSSRPGKINGVPEINGNIFVTAKYSPSGKKLWEYRYDTRIYGGGSSGTGIAIDSQKNVYAIGWAWFGSQDWNYCTIKFPSNYGDYPAGTDPSTVAGGWLKIYNGPKGNGTDYPYAIRVDEVSDPGRVYVYVTGGSVGISSNGATSYQDYATIKYDAANGETVWHLPLQPGENGASLGQPRNADGTGIAARWGGATVDDAWGMDVDSNGNVYVTGGG